MPETPRKKRKLAEGIQQWGGSNATFNISSTNGPSQLPLSPRRLRPLLRASGSQRDRVVVVPSTTPSTFFGLSGSTPTPTWLATPPLPASASPATCVSQAAPSLYSPPLSQPPLPSLSLVAPSVAPAQARETREATPSTNADTYPLATDVFDPLEDLPIGHSRTGGDAASEPAREGEKSHGKRGKARVNNTIVSGVWQERTAHTHPRRNHPIASRNSSRTMPRASWKLFFNTK